MSRAHVQIVRGAITTAWLVGLLIALAGEWVRFRSTDLPAWAATAADWNVDTTPFVPILVIAGVWLLPRLWKSEPERSEPGLRETSKVAPLVMALLIGALAFLNSWRVGQTPIGREGVAFASLPPAYHDDYAYLFQAKTYLAGRLAFPSQEPEGLFDQMHVLNEGRFASRYFPTTGVWLMPWVALDTPYVGHWVANALVAVLIFWTGFRSGGLLAGSVAGLLTALSPGMAVFSNMLLAHHPALLGLGVFLVAFLESCRGRPVWALLAGTGLAWAMLARPMTAAGVALPFGLWLLWRLWRDRSDRRGWLIRGVLLTLPLLAGLGLQAGYNKAITGEPLRTPYQLYTDIYTPRHVYGFNNVERGARAAGPRVIEKYDLWAENLTPRRAVRNVGRRVVASFQWTLGLVPLAMVGVVTVFSWPVLRTPTRLIFAAILSLHLAHVPYWYDGIMHWHYVFESGPLWCLLVGLLAADLRTTVSRPAWRVIRLAAAALLLVCVLVSYSGLAPLWETSRIRTAVDGIAFPRMAYARFHRLVETHVRSRPALVLVESNPTDIHMQYATNDPGLDADVLFGRAEAATIEEVRSCFPDRSLYVYSAVTGRLSRVADEHGSAQ